MILCLSVLMKGGKLRLGLESYLVFRSSTLPFDGATGSESAVLPLHRGEGDFGVGESQFDQSSSKSLIGAASDRVLDFFLAGNGVLDTDCE